MEPNPDLTGWLRYSFMIDSRVNREVGIEGQVVGRDGIHRAVVHTSNSKEAEMKKKSCRRSSKPSQAITVSMRYVSGSITSTSPV